MNPIPSFPVSLVCHEAAAAAPVASLSVAVLPAADGTVALEYRLEAELSLLRIAATGEMLDPERLWAHTCCELFLARAGERAYREYNFSPSGQWTGFAFADYRQRVEEVALPEPQLRWTRGRSSLCLAVTLPAAALPAGHGAVTFSPTMVVERLDGSCTYWALAHPASRPDFHDRRAFLLTLESS